MAATAVHEPTQVAARTRRPAGALMASLYFLLHLPMAILWMALTIAGIGLGLGTVLLWIGAPVLAFVMALWRGFARIERGLVSGMLGADIPDPYRPMRQGASWLRRWRAKATDPATWKDLFYLLLVNPILSVLWLGLSACLWAGGLGLSSLWFWHRFLPDHRATLFEINDKVHIVIDSTEAGLRWVPVGLLFFVVIYFALRGFARAHAAVARGLLGPSTRARLYARNVALEETRRRTVDAAEEERRRIERDLHDGTQQRLVAVAMDLGMAREKFETEPGAARELVEEAHAEAKRAIAELRDLVRGIHPAVLKDRGLDAALSALAGRCPVPVEVETRLPDRLDGALEAIAYFVVAEALTNVAKHAEATRAEVLVERAGGYLIVEVRDNGRGGAQASAGGGLAGLSDRAAGVDGRVTVDSPAGGPTVVRLELPCAS